MHKIVHLIAALLIILFNQRALAEEKPILATEQEKANYAIGVKFVRALVQRSGTVNLDLVIQGMKDSLTSERLLLSESEIRMAGTSEPAVKARNEKPIIRPGEGKARASGDVLRAASIGEDQSAGAPQTQATPSQRPVAATASPKGSYKRAQALIDRAKAARAGTGRDIQVSGASTISR